jgi:hypothetical protein
VRLRRKRMIGMTPTGRSSHRRKWLRLREYLMHRTLKRKTCFMRLVPAKTARCIWPSLMILEERYLMTPTP